MDIPKDATARVEQLINILSASGEEVSLEGICTEWNISLRQLRREFKTAVGLSPKEFSDAKKLERLRAELQGGESVTTAMYSAGFGSSRALYEKSNQNLGMTPRTYRSGGAGVVITYCTAKCRLGLLLVASSESGLCAVRLGDDATILLSELKKEFPNATLQEGTLAEFVEPIVKHLEGKQDKLDLPLDVNATAFTLRVWSVLKKIPYGQTRSYKEVAKMVGDEKAFRAVASACAKNPVALVIPCHRVVASDGKLAGYRWGLERKEKLLNQEKSA